MTADRLMLVSAAMAAVVTFSLAWGAVRRQRRAKLVSKRPLPPICEPCDGVVLEPGEKLVWFFRHGESVGNVLRRKAVAADASRGDGLCTEEDSYRTDEEIADGGLTSLGEAQASERAQSLRTWRVRPEVIMSSPLTRALQTTLLIFEDDLEAGVPLIIRPELREFFPTLIEDRGRTVAELRADRRLRQLRAWPALERALSDSATASWRAEWDARLAGGGAWQQHVLDGGRCVEFKEFMSKRAERFIATVSHWGTINNLVNREPCVDAAQLPRSPVGERWDPKVGT